MGAGQDLLAALQIGQTKPVDTGYGLAATGMAQAIPTLVNPYSSPGANLALTGGASILTAILTGLARNSAAETNAQIQPLQFEFMNPATSPARRAELQTAYPEAMAPIATQQLVQALDLQASAAQKNQDLNLTEPYDIRKEQRGLQQGYQKSVFDQTGSLLAKEGKVINPQTGETVTINSPGEIAAADSAKKIIADALAGNKAERVVLENKYGQPENVPAVLLNPELEAEQDKIKKDFSSLPEVKEFSVVKSSADALSKALADTGAVSDLELVRRSIQMIEPGMAVREGEQAAVAKSQSIPDSIKGEINRTFSSGTAMSDQAREGIKNLAIRAYEAKKAQYDQSLNFYKQEADIKGLDPKRVSYLGDAPATDSIFNVVAKGPATVDPSVPPGMKKQRNPMTGEERIVPR